MLNVQKLYNECLDQSKHLDTVFSVFKDELAKIGVDVRDYPEHGFMHLDYNMIECIKTHPIVIECRGLIMDYDGNIMCKSFDRFFNLGENGVDTFDFANSIAFEKADGSLVRIYFNAKTNKWEIATRGTAFAEGPHEWHGTFRGYILHCMQRTEEEFQDDCENNFYKHMTYIFEAVGPENRIVTKYNENQLVYLSSIDNSSTNREYLPHSESVDYFAGSMGWNVRNIKQYSFATQEDCLKTLGDLPDLGEGYVVYNKLTGARIKIKSPAYVAAHRLRGNGLTVNAICELVAMGEVDEYTAVFPEDAWKFMPAQETLGKIESDLIMNYAQHKHIESQKDFALAVKDLPLACCMFKARANKSDVIHEFNQFPVSKRAEWIKERLVNEKNAV